jgi:hypothetical protein
MTGFSSHSVTSFPEFCKVGQRFAGFWLLILWNHSYRLSESFAYSHYGASIGIGVGVYIILSLGFAVILTISLRSYGVILKLLLELLLTAFILSVTWVIFLGLHRPYLQLLTFILRHILRFYWVHTASYYGFTYGVIFLGVTDQVLLRVCLLLRCYFMHIRQILWSCYLFVTYLIY